ncbi:MULTISPECIES: iron-containing alcohol dehydrogenase [Thalassospira]|uniref:Alcohol dehydrogenase 2 n=2 Tax=Thalassospira TaxID=168934 RepID=A0A367VYK6_9PROT|nr:MULTISPECIES: iron-containing alcohol dehydrogenase [Thalassospira]MDG4720949.1 iron-containing alcohol dehydrogenase [Thalassospira sp. FZY0004]RCK31098.1 alcohol dehydrogenase [Thalassospira profundimaris]
MSDFTFETTPRVICEFDGALQLGSLCNEFGAKRAVLITDPGLKQVGLIDAPYQALIDAGIDTLLWTRVEADPPESTILEAVKGAQDFGADIIIGLGGGSSMDTAKLVALLCGNPQQLDAIYGIGLASGPRLPLIQVPTTAGTGSEVTPISIVTTPTQEKKGVVSPLLYPDVALLDAKLTMGLPASITAMTGIDAMVHAIEAYTTKHKKNALSDGLAIRGMQLMTAHIDDAVSANPSREAREAMLQGSMMAGMAFANAPVAAVHALAYPLGGHFHVPHGHSNALVLIEVLKFNRDAACPQYAELARAVLPGERFADDDAACDRFIDYITDMVERMPFTRQLRDLGVTEADLDMLATDAMKVERLLINNPREMTFESARDIYAAVL